MLQFTCVCGVQRKLEGMGNSGFCLHRGLLQGTVTKASALEQGARTHRQFETPHQAVPGLCLVMGKGHLCLTFTPGSGNPCG